MTNSKRVLWAAPKRKLTRLFGGQTFILVWRNDGNLLFEVQRNTAADRVQKRSRRLAWRKPRKLEWPMKKRGTIGAVTARARVRKVMR
jgi:hypothetical protein